MYFRMFPPSFVCYFTSWRRLFSQCCCTFLNHLIQNCQTSYHNVTKLSTVSRSFSGKTFAAPRTLAALKNADAWGILTNGSACTPPYFRHFFLYKTLFFHESTRYCNCLALHGGEVFSETVPEGRNAWTLSDFKKSSARY